MRIGFGFDVHKFSRSKKSLLLGNVEINCGFGIKAVSDGDVLLHAICDAILGAVSGGDIGDYYPPRDKECKGIKSIDITRNLMKKVMKDFTIVNMDTTVIAQRPPLVRYKKRIVDSLENIFKLPYVNIKIKSKEGLNILGGSDAIACFAVILLR